MRFARRLDAVPPYLFSELERKVEEKRRAGIDVISFGIGDPDLPTTEPVVEALRRNASRTETHWYPSNRGFVEIRDAEAEFYADRFGYSGVPTIEIIIYLIS